MQLSHPEALLLARLLGPHTVGFGELMRLAGRFIDYAERTEGEDALDERGPLGPLPLVSTIGTHGERVTFKMEEPEA